jgi:hypothetical protein
LTFIDISANIEIRKQNNAEKDSSPSRPPTSKRVPNPPVTLRPFYDKAYFAAKEANSSPISGRILMTHNVTRGGKM